MLSPDLKIIPISALKDNYIWAIINKQTHEAIVVDPGEVLPVNDFLKEYNLKLKAILLTHHHWDHTNGAEELKTEHNVPVFGSKNENTPAATEFLQEPDVVNIEGFPELRVLNIPGHTLGHIAYYADGMLFCGDTLFSAGCGRLFEGTAKQMYQSLNKLAELPGDTKIYCGHEYTLKNLQFAEHVEPDNQAIQVRINTVTELRSKNLPSLPSTMKDELATNPFLRCKTVERFADLRQMKDNF